MQELKIAETTIQHILLYLLTGEITHVYGTITLYFESWELLFQIIKLCIRLFEN